MNTLKRSLIGVSALVLGWMVACGDDITGPGPFPARMYIGNVGAQSVLMFAAPYTAGGGPSDSLKWGSNGQVGVAVDANGNLVVMTNAGRVYFYDATVNNGDTPRDSVQAGSSGGLLALGPGGKLFVPSQTTRVLIYTPPFTGASVPDTVSTGMTSGFSVAFDGVGRLYVGDNGGSGGVHVYTSPYTGAPAFTVSNGLTSTTRGVALDADNRLYVADVTGDRILVFNPPLSASSNPAFEITSGVDGPEGILIGSDGRLYVVNFNASPTVTIFEPPFSSSSSPTVTMSGGGRFSAPFGIALGAH